ncbi:hypothetical protein LTR22_004105 [Elasticomyces elasticus]|nr:hypothetical protein LTR22_004105 [Elasticomyces elasticus]
MRVNERERPHNYSSRIFVYGLVLANNSITAIWPLAPLANSIRQEHTAHHQSRSVKLFSQELIDNHTVTAAAAAAAAQNNELWQRQRQL